MVPGSYAMYLNIPPVGPKEVFSHFKDLPYPLGKGNSDWFCKDLVQRCEELVHRRLTAKEFSPKKKNGTTVCKVDVNVK